ncbi:MAG: elongation factor EF-2 [Candidatus Nanoarchaeia archaeon]|nr:elongation factor EF-2 [Candidatus Nanoarchaeia archaeon]MDD5053789.1 elongation factor EF-2 [Candidatus Nanoarchaeia archaeon]
MAKNEEISIVELMHSPPKIRNLGIIAHIDHGKSTLSDSLLAGAGLLSTRVAGEARATDTLEEEQQRGITILASAVTMVHKFQQDYYLINLLDTPGHVDFGGEVSRSLRAVDGALVVVCAVEGVMPQTETVLKQAIRERVKPILFINKVDRLLKELKITPEQMQERFINIINKVNKMIVSLAPKEFKESWQVRVQDGSVAFGSAHSKWALSSVYMKQTGLSFKDVIEAYTGSDEEKKEKVEKLAEKAPLHEVVLDMTIHHHPSPDQAQKYRVPHLWKGDLDSEIGKSLVNCDPKGKTVFIATKVKTDPTFGELVFGRVFSGTLKQGQELFMSRKQEMQKAQKVFIMVCDKRTPLEEIPVGCTSAIIGIKDATSGETLSQGEITPFEGIKHIFDAVVTKAIEAKNPADLPKLIQVLRDVNKEDPTISIKIDEETGEHLIAGLGELHLEDVIDRRIVKERKLQVKASPPIVVYREGVSMKNPSAVEGKSPNKHNKFYIHVAPLEQGVLQGIAEGKISEGKAKKLPKEFWKDLFEAGMDKDEARAVKDIFQGNVFIDMTKGEVHMIEIMESVLEAFEAVMREGPLCREPVQGVKVILVDVKMHEDSIHRGPAQIIPAVRDALKEAFREAKPTMLEPVQELRIDAPNQFLGNISKLIGSRRGQLIDSQFEGEELIVKAKMPVAESFGFTGDLRGATEGRGVWSLMESQFEKLPSSLQQNIITSIRNRKGLTENQ